MPSKSRKSVGTIAMNRDKDASKTNCWMSSRNSQSLHWWS